MDNQSRMRRLVPINRLPAILQDKALASAKISDFAPGSIVLGAGTNATDQHYLLQGTIEFIWNAKLIHRLVANTDSALEPMLEAGENRYVLKAAGKVTIASFPRTTLARLLEQHEAGTYAEAPQVSDLDAEQASDWQGRLLQSALFSALPATSIQQLLARMESIEVREGDVICRQGEPGDYYYLIGEGYCEVSRALGGGRGQVHLAELGPGAGFGEASLISTQPRNATVSMISPGRLLRIGSEDFHTLICAEILHSYSASELRSNDTAVLLDIRQPEEFANGTLRGAVNLPADVLRIRARQLDAGKRYIVIGADQAQARIAAFLLLELGYDAIYLEQTLEEAIHELPDMFELHHAGAPQTGTDEGTSMSETTPPPADDDQPDTDLDNTISRVAGLYTHEEAEREMHNRVPEERFADTATGQELASIIGQMSDQHDELGEADSLDLELDADADSALARESAAETEEDFSAGVSELMQEMEARLHSQLTAAVKMHTERLEKDYLAKIARMRELTNAEIKSREGALRRKLTEEYADKELRLRSYYKKLIALANKISHQKAQLQEAKKQFELKLVSANRLVKEVDEMRQLLSDNIGYLDAQAIEDVPKLPVQL